MSFGLLLSVRSSTFFCLGRGKRQSFCCVFLPRSREGSFGLPSTLFDFRDLWYSMFKLRGGVRSKDRCLFSYCSMEKGSGTV